MEPTFVTQVVLPVALAVVMLGLGLSLTPADFSRVWRAPKAVLVGLGAQMLLVPLAAWGLVHLFNLRPELAIGLVVLSLCPGGPTATLLTHISKGDTALSVTLTALTSVLTVVTVPAVVNLLMADLAPGTTVSLPFANTFGQLFIITLIPVAIGMTIRARASAFADRADRPVKLASGIFVVLVIVGAIVQNRANLGSFFAQVGVPALLLNLVALGTGFAAGGLLKLRREESVCLAIDTAICNGTLAIFITATLLQNPAMAIPAAIYSLLMFLTAPVVTWLNLRRPHAVPGVAAVEMETAADPVAPR